MKMEKIEKIDLRKNNGGHKNGGRKKKFPDGFVMKSVKFRPDEAAALESIKNYGEFLQDFVRAYFKLDILPDEMPNSHLNPYFDNV